MWPLRNSRTERAQTVLAETSALTMPPNGSLNGETKIKTSQLCVFKVPFERAEEINQAQVPGASMFERVFNASCAAPCLGSCPLGIPIPERTKGAHDLLSSFS